MIKKLITILVCISSIYMIVQPFRILIEGGQSVSMLIPTLLIVVSDKLFGNKSIIMATIYSAIVIILRSIGVEYFELYLSQIVTTFFSICCMEHYIKTKDERFAKYVLITYFGCFVFMCLISIPQFYLFPEITRQLVFAEHDGNHVESIYYWSIAYSSMHEIPLLLIPLIALIKFADNFTYKIISILSITILFVALLLGDATTPLLLSVVIIFVLAFYKTKKPFSYNLKRLFIVSGLLVILLNKVVLISLLTTIQPLFEGTTNFSKIEDTKYQIQSGQVDEDTNLGQRDLAYNMSKKVFWSHPLGVEMGNEKIGKHSFILDHLAVLGLILIIPLVILTYQRYYVIVGRLKYYKFFFIVCYMAFLAMAYSKNFFLKIEAWYIVPMFLILLEKKYNNNESNKFIVSKSA